MERGGNFLNQDKADSECVRKGLTHDGIAMVVQSHSMLVMAEVLRGVGLPIVQVQLWQSEAFGWLSPHNVVRERWAGLSQQSL